MSSNLDNTAVSDRISELYLSSDLADISFEFESDNGNELVSAHKTILAVASPVFRAWFFGDGEENGLVTKVGKTEKIVDATAAAFKEFLQFFYRRKVTLTMENIEEVALLADKYDMLDSVEACATFLVEQLKTDDIIWGYQLANTLRNQELIEFCEKQIKMFTNDLFKSESFLHCDRSVLKNILEMEVLQCSETEVFDACIKWARFNCEKNGLDESRMENLKQQLGECFYLIRFCSMDKNTFVEHTEPLNDLFTRDELIEIMYKKPGKFNQNARQQIIQWDEANIIKCKSETYSYVESPITTRPSVITMQFSTNIPVLFVGFALNHSPNDPTYEIYEVQSNSSIVALITTGSVELLEIGYKLSTPVIVNPKKMYEIRLKFGKDYYFEEQMAKWRPQIKLNEKLTVNIPSCGKGARFISNLFFNSI